ncbi:hypothetical protein [Kitasatospora sp. NPDC091276]|uniref:hypothetical protein n=1 Tax=unclassified Kitasatospora TaxID=2633591 RepID=UPI00342CC7D1
MSGNLPHLGGTSMTPNVEGVTLSFRSMCSGGCTTSGPAWGGAPVILDRDAGGSSTIDYDSHVAKDGIEQIHPAYHVSGETLGAYPLNTEGDFYGPDLRCDAAVGGNAGCIVMGHLADVTLSKSQFGAATVACRLASATGPVRRRLLCRSQMGRHRCCGDGPSRVMLIRSGRPDLSGPGVRAGWCARRGS